jgi:transposase InsO family protein
VEATTNIIGNKLSRDFSAPAPNTKWVSDITYIKVGRRWMYLAAVMDLSSRKIVGWSLDSHMREELILDALDMAVTLRQPEDSLLVHSDRGVQYRENAAMESFFSRLKVELIYAENFKTVDEAKSEIFSTSRYSIIDRDVIHHLDISALFGLSSSLNN